MTDWVKQSYSEDEANKGGVHTNELEAVDDDIKMDDLYYADREEWEEYVREEWKEYALRYHPSIAFSAVVGDTPDSEIGGVYPKFPKIDRLYSDICITEKIDGTNGLIYVSKDGMVRAGSRNKWLYIDQDNYGFCAWVSANYEELAKLGPGRHYGEWYGSGIQRGYGLTEKRFALFNPTKDISHINIPTLTKVPVLYSGTFSQQALRSVELELLCGGSQAAEGFVNPEGFMVYFTKANLYLKVPLN